MSDPGSGSGRSGSLSKLILDYYYKYGQNRDIEKYLRLRKNHRLSGHYSKSSSEISLNLPEFFENNFQPKVSYHSEEKESEIEEHHSEECLDKDSRSENVYCNSKNYVKTVQQLTSSSLPEIFKDLEDFIPETRIDRNKIQQQYPEQKTVDLDSSSVQSEPVTRPKSPNTSIKSNKRLEWDSLGDVGYEKSCTSVSKILQPNAVSTIEKNVLKNFFSERGIEITFKRPSAYQPSGKENVKKCSNLEPKEKWRETLESARKKYGSGQSPTAAKQRMKSNSELKFQSLAQNFHSTPIGNVKMLEKFSQTSFVRTQNQQIQAQLSNVSSTRSGIQSTDVGTSAAASVSSFEYFALPDNMNDGSSKSDEETARSSIATATTDRQTVRKVEHNEQKCLSSIKNSSSENNEIKLGVKLLCSLIEAKTISETQKIRLANKIAAKIAKKSTESTASLSLSTMTSVSAEDLIEGVKKLQLEQKESNENAVSLKCNTMDKSVPKVNENLAENLKNQAIPITTVNSSSRSSSRRSVTFSSSDDQQKSDRKTNEWLEPLTVSELKYNEKHKILPRKAATIERDCHPNGKRKENVLQCIAQEKRTHLNWIETEIKHLENLRNLLIYDTADQSNDIAAFANHKTIHTFPMKSSKQENIYDRVATSLPDYSISTSSDVTNSINAPDREIISELSLINPQENYKRSQNRTIQQRTVINAETQRPERQTIVTVDINEEQRFPKTRTLQKAQTETRSKLETPPEKDEESVESFARQRRKSFLHAYTKKSTDRLQQSCPANSDHYSEPRAENMRKPLMRNDASTSVTLSDLLISSDSISVPFTSGSSTTTTTHRYDNRLAVAVQTSDSLRRTEPIFGKSGCQCNNSVCHCPSKPTIRVYKPVNTRPTQTAPPPLAYVITFENKENKRKQEVLTLQDQLSRNCPQICANVEKRQKILKKLHQQRKERENKIRDIVENTSYQSMQRKFKELPPPPTKYTRIFGTKEMKAQTQKRYAKLPEVVERVEKNKIEKRKKSNKILADMFNRRLQRRVKQGKVELEHSGTVI